MPNINMTNKWEKIGVLGGTFDPIHFGHLIIAEEIKDRYNLDKIIFIPCGMPSHKDTSKVSDTFHRMNMVQIAIDTNIHFEVSDIEIRRKGYTYTIDTVLQLKHMYPKSDIFHIIGADIVSDLSSWKKCDELFANCEFIVTIRNGFTENRLKDQIKVLENLYNAKINLANVRLIDISSTEIRKNVKSNMSIKYLLPEAVEKYIFVNNLYRR